jgi:hypothetical protein
MPACGAQGQMRSEIGPLPSQAMFQVGQAGLGHKGCSAPLADHHWRFGQHTLRRALRCQHNAADGSGGAEAPTGVTTGAITRVKPQPDDSGSSFQRQGARLAGVGTDAAEGAPVRVEDQ